MRKTVLLCCVATLLHTGLMQFAFACPKAGYASNDSTIIVGDFHFRIPMPYESDAALLSILQQANETLAYIAILDLQGKKTPLSISVYKDAQAHTIEEAFKANITFKPAGKKYKVLDHGAVIREGKTLRFKITETDMGEGATINSVIYYFMNKGHSNELYELKVVCGPESLQKAMHAAEKIAVTAGF